MSDLASHLEARLPKADMLSVSDVSAALNVCVLTVYAWVEAGEIDAIDMGRGKKRFWKLSRASLVDFLQRRNLGRREPIRPAISQLELFPAAAGSNQKGARP